MNPPPELVAGTSVDLRRVAPDDGDTLFRLTQHADVMRYMDWPMPADAADVASHLRKAVVDWSEGTEFQWLIIDRGTREVVGTISCRPRDHAADFGYFLGKDHWGKGFALEAAAIVVDWLKRQPGLTRIWASADAENMRSRRLLERLGLRLESILRMATVRPNIGATPRNTAIHAWCRGDV